MKRFLQIDEAGNTVREVAEAWVDGYTAGDRLLEGVMFKITITPENTFRAEIDPNAAEYFATLNSAMWLKAVEDYCENNDVWGSTHAGGDDVYLEDTDAPPVKVQPLRVVTMTPLSDILGNWPNR